MKKLLIFIGAFIYAQNIFASPSIYYYQDSSGKYQCMVESDGMTESEQKYILCSDIQVTL